MSLTKPVVNLYGPADPREECRVQVIENNVGVGKEGNAETKQKRSADRETQLTRNN